MEDFRREFFIIMKVFGNLPFPRYDIKEYNGDEIIGAFLRRNSSDMKQKVYIPLLKYP